MIIVIAVVTVIIIVIFFKLCRWKILLAARASEDHLESMVLMVTLDLPELPDLPDLRDIMVQRVTLDLPDLQDMMALRALQDHLDYLVYRVFVDHLGSMVPGVHLDPGPVPVFLRLYLALAYQHPRRPSKKLQRRNKMYVKLKIVKVVWFWKTKIKSLSSIENYFTTY